MNLGELHRTLIQAARSTPPSDRVPFAFEKRIMARLQSTAVVDSAALWARGLWRAAAACLAVVIVLSAVSLFAPSPTSSSNDLAQDFEKTMLAAADQDTDYSSW